MEKNISLTFKGEFSLYVPESTRHQITEEGTTFEVHIPTVGGAVLIKRYPLEKTHKFLLSLEQELISHAKRFIEECVSPRFEECSAVVDKVSKDEENGYWYVQSLIKISGKQWWLFRIISKLQVKDFYLMHWNGLEKNLKKDVFPVFTSFAYNNLSEEILSS